MNIILFDIDGTLITTGGAGQGAMDVVSVAHATVEADPSEVQYSGRTDKSIIRDHLQLFGIEETPDNIAAYRDDFLSQLPQKLAEKQGRVLPQVIETLERLGDSSYELGLITGNMRAAAKMKLDHYGLANHFYSRGGSNGEAEAMGGFGDEHFERDDMAREALDDVRSRLGTEINGDQIWVVGDTPKDVQCAKAIGAKVMAVATGRYSYEVLIDTAPNLVCRSLAEAEAWWEQLNV